MKAFRTLDEANVAGKRVLVRVDLNVPMENGRVSDDTRIRAAAPTIKEITGKGGKAILLSHFGRPKGRDESQSLASIVPTVATVLGSRSPSPRTAIARGREGGRRDETGRRAGARDTPLHAGEEKTRRISSRHWPSSASSM